MNADPFWPVPRKDPAGPRRGADSPPSIQPGPGRMLRRPLRIGVAVIAIFSMAFVGWGATAPLAGGAVAAGRVTPDGGVRVVQHLEGGIVGEIHVRDGDRVEEGDPLVSLAHIAANSEVRVLRQRERGLRAELARLEAEIAGRNTLDFPQELLSRDPALMAQIDAQRRIFETGRAMVETRKAILGLRIDQLREQITGANAQVESAAEQIALLQEEIADKTALLSNGLLPKGELLQLQRMLSGLRGALGEHRAEISRSEQQIGETRLELLSMDADRTAQNAARAGEIRDELGELMRSLEAKTDVLERAVITAPVSGIVANVRIVTTGGVVGPGEPILDIVPNDDQLLVDAMVQPADIDLVTPGAAASVTLTAYAENKLPKIEGRVRSISANTLRDEISGRDYYAARIEIPRDRLEDDDLALLPGMAAEVMIVSSDRTLLEYLFDPLSKIVRRGLRES